MFLDDLKRSVAIFSNLIFTKKKITVRQKVVVSGSVVLTFADVFDGKNKFSNLETKF
jgi:hypothetical protein